MFYDRENDTISHSYSINPTASFIAYNVTSKELSIDAGGNDAGVYEFSLTAKDQHNDTGSTDSKFNITVINNEAPVTSEVFTNVTMLAYYPFEFVFNSSKFSDINGDSISFNMSTNASWIQTHTSELKFNGTTNNTLVDVYEIALTAYDDYGGINDITYTINITENHLPVKNSVPIPEPLEVNCLHTFTFNFSEYFYDPDGEQIKIEDRTPTRFSYMIYDNTTGVMSGYHNSQ